MPRYISTQGLSPIAIGICGRCSRKFPLADLTEDGNIPGLLVCLEDWDRIDPWRLPARETEDISLQNPRPDVSLSVGPMNVAINPMQLVLEADNMGNTVETNDTLQEIGFGNSVSTIYPSTPWLANTVYSEGQQVTPTIATGLTAAGQNIYIYVCLYAGTSGVSAPNWPPNDGALIIDNTVLWKNAGLYLP